MLGWLDQLVSCHSPLEEPPRILLATEYEAVIAETRYAGVARRAPGAGVPSR